MCGVFVNGKRQDGVLNMQEENKEGMLPAFTSSDSLEQSVRTLLGSYLKAAFLRHGSGGAPIAYIQNKATKTEPLVFWNTDLKQVRSRALLPKQQDCM